MTESSTSAFEVMKADLRQNRFEAPDSRPLVDGEARLLVDAFALTANNITYGVFGDAMRYWNFFPASDPFWGRIPVWGFSTVNESLHEDLAPGERFFGFLPMASELIVSPDNVRSTGFMDAASHRQGLPEFYNMYSSVSNDPAYRADFENQQMLFRPLFMTSFLIDDQLAENAFYGASRVILSSASSKTALALAWHLKKRGITTLALTSKGSRAFVRNSGMFDEIVLYEDIAEELSNIPSVFVDFAGNPHTLAAVHTKHGMNLKASIMVGATNWQAERAPDAPPLPGPEPQFFFAPDQGNKRAEEWGAEEFNRRISDNLIDFYEPASHWIKPVRGIGHEAILECYERLLEGKALPSEGYILSFGI